MATTQLLIGPPGCGKTHRLIDIVKTAILEGIPPERIGYVSFTRKAVEEARERAGGTLGLTEKDMPFFRTLHSLSYAMVGLRKQDVMDPQDWKLLGKTLGMDITGTSRQRADEGFIVPQGLGGDMYVGMVERARMRGISLEQEYAETADHDLRYPMLQRIEGALDAYCRDTNKVTFVGMLQKFLTIGEAPALDILIVDEAQDLVPLQWQIVTKLMTRAKQVYFAGDDDQAIHRWAGVDVELFAKSSENQSFLTQSHRLPRSVHKLSQSIVTRIPNRIPKDFQPTDREGTVTTVLGRDSLDLSEGSWTLMARTNGYVSDWCGQLHQSGFFYSHNGTPSVDPNTAENLNSWRRLQQGEGLLPREVRQMYDQMPKQGDLAVLARGAIRLLDPLDPEHRYTFEELSSFAGLRAAKETDAFRALAIAGREAEYVRSLERRGVDITAAPRIKVSTFHAMKGGEDDNVAVYLGTTQSCANSRFPSDEIRAFYVGITRAKNHLSLVASDKKQRFIP